MKDNIREAIEKTEQLEELDDIITEAFRKKNQLTKKWVGYWPLNIKANNNG